MGLPISSLLTLPSLLREPDRDPERVAELRNRRLRRVVQYAYENVPYYHRLFDRHGLHPEDIRTVADLSAIPLTAKQDLRESAPEDLLARRDRNRRLVTGTSSGTTGQPFFIRRTPLEQTIHYAYWVRALRHFGYRLHDKVLLIQAVRGTLKQDTRRHVRLFNALGLFRRRLVDCQIPTGEIVEAIREYRPDLIYTYPGLLGLLADVLGPAASHDVRPRLVVSGGEMLLAPMRPRIEAAFGTPARDVYGSWELSITAWECVRTGLYHVADDGVIVEVLKDGRPAKPGERGELVGTNLRAFTMPFIRYRQGDLVTRGPDRCPCGAHYSTIEDLDGRIINMFPLPGGRILDPRRLIVELLDLAKWVNRYQVIHVKTDEILARVVPWHRPSPEDLAKLQTGAKAVVGPDVTFRVELVDEIPMEPGGKFRVCHSLVAGWEDERASFRDR